MPAGLINLEPLNITNEPDFLLSKKPKQTIFFKPETEIRGWGEGCSRHKRQILTRVMTPSLSTSLAGLCGPLRGVERPLCGGEGPVSTDVGCGGASPRDLNRPGLSKLPLPTRLSISSARCSVLSFSSCISLKQKHIVSFASPANR